MNNGGKIALLGIPPKQAPIDWNDIFFKGLTLQGIYGRRMYEVWYRMLAMLQTGLDVSPVITHHFPADQYEEAFAVMETADCGKVILDWECRPLQARSGPPPTGSTRASGTPPPAVRGDC